MSVSLEVPFVEELVLGGVVGVYKSLFFSFPLGDEFRAVFSFCPEDNRAHRVVEGVERFVDFPETCEVDFGGGIAGEVAGLPLCDFEECRDADGGCGDGHVASVVVLAHRSVCFERHTTPSSVIVQHRKENFGAIKKRTY